MEELPVLKTICQGGGHQPSRSVLLSQLPSLIGAFGEGDQARPDPNQNEYSRADVKNDMKQYYSTDLGRLRALGFLEGTSMLILLFIAMPVKYLLGNPALVQSVGMAHGVLFVLFVIYTLAISVTQRWSFWSITWKVLLASIVPFGTFYVDRKILSRLDQGGESGLRQKA